jgi:short-subunit dehydrogenase
LPDPRTILITGASSGIGAALATAYAAAGKTLILCGRNRERLAATAGACRSKGATVGEVCFDMGDLDGLSARLQEIDGEAPLDLAILNAGIGGFAAAGQIVEPVETARAIATVNFSATVVAATALAERMAGRGRGHIVLIGSISESFPLPMAPTYAASKAGLRLYAEALDLQLRRRGVAVSLVSPGFVDTPMSRGLPFPKPFLMTADAAAAAIKMKLARGARRIVVPRAFAILRTLAKMAPRSLVRAVLSRQNAAGQG